MSEIKVAINGFGRIGRISLRAFQKNPRIRVVAINDLTKTRTLAHLFKYDTVHRAFDGTVEVEEDDLIVNGNRIKVLSEANPEKLPWQEMGVDIVLESTGKFRTSELAGKHLQAGAKKVIISAPPQSNDIKTIVLGVNDELIDGSEQIISNASCTTNSAAPLVHILDELAGIETAYITTVHSYTTDQKLHDAPHADLRRARAAAASIVPTTTGAAKALTKIFPRLDGKLGGAGIRVPVPNASLTDLTCIMRDDTSIEEVNRTFKEKSQGEFKGLLQYLDEPLVSTDIIGNSHSCIFDAELTSVIGKMVKVVGWYDNEMGYSNRLSELMVKISD